MSNDKISSCRSGVSVLANFGRRSTLGDFLEHGSGQDDHVLFASDQKRTARDAVRLQGGAHDAGRADDDPHSALAPLGVVGGQFGVDLFVGQSLAPGLLRGRFQDSGKRIVLAGRADHAIDQPSDGRATVRVCEGMRGLSFDRDLDLDGKVHDGLH